MSSCFMTVMLVYTEFDRPFAAVPKELLGIVR